MVPASECDFTSCDQLNYYGKLSYSKHVFLHSANSPNCLRHATLLPPTELYDPLDLGGHGDLGDHVLRDLRGHVSKVEVVGDHRIVSNQRVRLKLRACESFQEKIFSDQTGEIFSKHL